MTPDNCYRELFEVDTACTRTGNMLRVTTISLSINQELFDPSFISQRIPILQNPGLIHVIAELPDFHLKYQITDIIIAYSIIVTRYSKTNYILIVTYSFLLVYYFYTN